MFLLLVGRSGRRGHTRKGGQRQAPACLVKNQRSTHLQTAALCPYLAIVKERYSSPGCLSHGSPSSPAVLSPFDQPGTQEDGRLQVAPHKRHARTAKGLDGGGEGMGERMPVSRDNCLMGSSGSLLVARVNCFKCF